MWAPGGFCPAHLHGYQLLRQVGVDDFRITALTSRSRWAAESYVHRDRGPAPRPAVSKAPSDPLSVEDVFISDFQDDVEAKVYDHLEEMLDEVDALDITASLEVHHTATLLGIGAGKHCLVQKPFAISVAAARQMVDAARARRVSLGVNENLRYAPNVRIARWLIEQGYLGDLQTIAHWSIGTAEWSPDRVVADTPWRHRKLEAGARRVARHRRAPAARAALSGWTDRLHFWRDAHLRADTPLAGRHSECGVRRGRRVLRDGVVCVRDGGSAHVHLGRAWAADEHAGWPGDLWQSRLPQRQSTDRRRRRRAPGSGGVRGRSRCADQGAVLSVRAARHVRAGRARFLAFDCRRARSRGKRL